MASVNGNVTEPNTEEKKISMIEKLRAKVYHLTKRVEQLDARTHFEWYCVIDLK